MGETRDKRFRIARLTPVDRERLIRAGDEWAEAEAAARALDVCLRTARPLR